MDKRRLIRHAIYDKITGCLISLYSRDSRGYPQAMLHGRNKGTHGAPSRIHRALLELKLGRKLDINEFAIHKCNNRRCISTAVKHVVKGDKSENTLDAIERGSHNRLNITRGFRKPWKH